MRVPICLVLLQLGGCNTSRSSEAISQDAARVAPQESAAAAAGRQAFGAALGKSPTVALADVLRNPDKFANQTLLLEGQVRRACSRKGCWMELSESADTASAGCRVTFKDYGFFVPTDAAGSKARVEAAVQTKVVPASQVAHLEEEGAKFADKAPDGTAREVRLVATGVELWR